MDDGIAKIAGSAATWANLLLVPVIGWLWRTHQAAAQVPALREAISRLEVEIERLEDSTATRADVAELDRKLTRVHERLDDMPRQTVELLRLTMDATKLGSRIAGSD